MCAILGSEYFLMASELMNTTKMHEEYPRSIYISTAKSMNSRPHHRVLGLGRPR